MNFLNLIDQVLINFQQFSALIVHQVTVSIRRKYNNVTYGSSVQYQSEVKAVTLSFLTRAILGTPAIWSTVLNVAVDG